MSVQLKSDYGYGLVKSQSRTNYTPRSKSKINVRYTQVKMRNNPVHRTDLGPVSINQRARECRSSMQPMGKMYTLSDLDDLY